MTTKNEFDQVDLGTHVELLLNQGSCLFTGLTEVPTIFGPTARDEPRSKPCPSEVRITGYISQISQDYLEVVAGWDLRKENVFFADEKPKRIHYTAINATYYL